MRKNTMVKHLGISLMVLLVSCSVRKDILFSAVDELHYIQLYSRNNDFEILHNGINTAQGRYELKGDTILLHYLPGQLTIKRSEELDGANAKLTRVLIIERKRNHVRSADKHYFCANIAVNQLAQTTSVKQVKRHPDR
ncbi:hypothetical protein [Hymenobacter cellulosivorans]|uniref:Lipoprotein n=1 Tax=Hymenobacter cellulosivorans TaxID=2932249 RepID=A0ABY4FHG1_9BACT|nr:hypothetical protein [Hymenobacter cellulosivorans]UOQ55382.1 hypothetical protein MUN80_11645 [Hymenobacter cellulosivorans]